jgi:hypothetical protein
MTLTIQIAEDLERGLRAAAGREGLPLDRYIRHLIEGDLRASGDSTGDDEPALLRRINLGLSDEDWRRYRALSGKLRAEALTQVEQAELIQLADAVEEAKAHRIAALAKLAELRGTTLDALMKELDIASPGYV